MTIIDELRSFLSSNPVFSDEKAPEGFCPNCWGKQEYGGKFYELAKNYKADIKANDPKVGWVQDYANKHLSKITLYQKNDLLVCPNCKLNYTVSKD